MNKGPDSLNKVAAILAIIAAFIAFGFIGHSDAEQEIADTARQCQATPEWRMCLQFKKANHQVAR